MLSNIPILIIASQTAIRDSMAEIVRGLGLEPVLCSSIIDARAEMARQTFPCIFCSDDLPDCGVRMALRVLQASASAVPIVVLSHVADWDAYLAVLRAGAFDYIACPPDREEARRILRLALGQDPGGQRVTHAVA
jgi:two-component system, NtrC family, response regulator PilR